MNFKLNQEVSEKWSYSLEARYNKDFLDQNNSDDFNHSERTGLEWINQFEVNQFNKTLVGIIIDDETFTASNYGVGVDVDFENKAMFIEHLYSKSSHQALIAFRTSNSDFTKDKDAWNVEYGYRINPNLRVMILGGSPTEIHPHSIFMVLAETPPCPREIKKVWHWIFSKSKRVNGIGYEIL